jgi:putative inorganic carbon (HCO3(-)) transporter
MMSDSTRRRFLVVIVLWTLAAALGLGAWVQSRPPENPLGIAYDLAWEGTTERSLGVNVNLAPLPVAARRATLDNVQAAGLRWVRLRFPWDQIEPQPGAWNWAPWDDLVEDVTSRGLQLIAVLDGSPAWARATEDADNPLAPPRERHDFGRFVAAFAARYGDRVDHYQVWDEPNIAPHWGTSLIDPADYAGLLREGAIQLRAADPVAVVLSAALAPNVEPAVQTPDGVQGGVNLSDVDFLDALYQAGAAPWFDVVAAQPYGFAYAPSDPPDPNQLNFARLVLLRQVMLRHGDADTALWAVSMGWSGGRASAYAAQAVTLARDSWPWLGPMLWAAWLPSDRLSEYALLGSPALTAWQEAVAARSVATLGHYPPDHPSGEYAGAWRVTSEGADVGTSGDCLRIRFRGTRLDLRVRRGAYRAYLYVTVNGRPADALPRDQEGRTYVVLYDPLHSTADVTLARDLPFGEHVVELVAERGWGQWAVDGWTVSRQGPSRSPGWIALLALAAAVLGAAGAWAAYGSQIPQTAWGMAQRAVNRYGALPDWLHLVLGFGALVLLDVLPGTPLSLAALSLLALILFLRPETGLPLIAFALPFYQRSKPLLGKHFSLVEIVTLVTLAAWLARVLLAGVLRSQQGRDGLSSRPEPESPRSDMRRAAAFLGRWQPNRLTLIDWGVLALVLVGLLSSVLVAEHRAEALREFRTVVLESAIWYMLLRLLIHRRRSRWWVADAWVAGGAAVALVAAGQLLTGQGLITAEGVSRVRALYGSPNNLALYLGRVLPLAIAVAVWGTVPARRWAYGLTALVVAVAIFFTYSRGAWLLGVPLALLAIAALRGRRVLVAVVGLLGAAALVALPVLGTERITSLLDTSQGTSFFRLQLWRSAWSMIRDHPVWGVGLDNFLPLYRTRYVLPSAWQELNLSHPHNVILDAWLRLGLPGLLILSGLLGLAFRQGLRTFRRLPDGPSRALLLGLLGGLVSFLAHGLVDNAYFLVDLAFTLALQLALIQAVSADRAPANTDSR